MTLQAHLYCLIAMTIFPLYSFAYAMTSWEILTQRKNATAEPGY